MAEDYKLTPDELAAALGASTLSEQDKRFVLRSLWTQQEVSEIETASQYEAYAQWRNEIHAKLKQAGMLPTDLVWSRSQDGVLATSIGARMIEWEEKQ